MYPPGCNARTTLHDRGIRPRLGFPGRIVCALVQDLLAASFAARFPQDIQCLALSRRRPQPQRRALREARELRRAPK
jgi:hypothetical protein